MLIQELTKKKRCWGYEQGCLEKNAYSNPVCNGDYKGWAKSNEEYVNRFYEQADFGYIKARANEMRIMCEPLFKVSDSNICCYYN